MKLGEIRKANPTRQLIISYLQDVVCLIEETLTESKVQKIYEENDNKSIDTIQVIFCDDIDSEAYINVYPQTYEEYLLDERPMDIISIDFKMLEEKYLNENISILRDLFDIYFHLAEKKIKVNVSYSCREKYEEKALFVGNDRTATINDEQWEVIL